MILCIDDEPVGLQVRKMVLQRHGYEVLTAPSGLEGLETTRSQSRQRSRAGLFDAWHERRPDRGGNEAS